MKSQFLLTQVLILALFHANPANAQNLDLGFPTANGTVKTILIHGKTMYIGGEFTAVGNSSRNRIAAIDIPSKSVTAWNPNVNKDVADIKVANGKVYFCGHFTSVNSISRNALAVVDSATGAVEPLNPTIVFPGIPGGNQTGTIASLAITDNTLYLAGYFASVNGTPRNNIAALDINSGALKPFNSNTDVPINLLKLDGNTLYLGGPFSIVNGTGRIGFAAVNRVNGTVLPWAPSPTNPGNTIYSIVPDGNNVFISGIITNLNNQNHCFLAKTDQNGIPANWDPFSCVGTFSIAKAVYISDSILVVGGSFGTYSGFNRKNLVLANKVTGTISPWNPSPDNEVTVVTGNDSLIVVGGTFTNISGAMRPKLAVYNRNSLQTNTKEPGFAAQKINGYPNPTQATFTIPLDQKDVERVSIYTKDGKMVKAPCEISESSLLIKSEQLPAGEYVVSIETRSGERYVAMFTRMNP